MAFRQLATAGAGVLVTFLMGQAWAEELQPDKVITGIVGIDVAKLEELAKKDPALQLRPGIPQGVYVLSVLPESPAAQSGIQPRDVITRVATTSLRTFADLTMVVDALPAGEPVKLRVARFIGKRWNQTTLETTPQTWQAYAATQTIREIDEVSRATVLRHRNQDLFVTGRTRLQLFAVDDDLMLRFRLQKSLWLFVHTVTVRVGEQAQTWEFRHDDVKRNVVDAGVVAECVTVPVEGETLETVLALSRGATAIVRFTGKDSSVDYEVPAAELLQLKCVLMAFKHPLAGSDAK